MLVKYLYTYELAVRIFIPQVLRGRIETMLILWDVKFMYIVSRTKEAFKIKIVSLLIMNPMCGCNVV